MSACARRYSETDLGRAFGRALDVLSCLPFDCAGAEQRGVFF